MVCQVCGKNPATVHFTEIHDNKMSEIHVCERCAEEKGLHASAEEAQVRHRRPARGDGGRHDHHRGRARRPRPVPALRAALLRLSRRPAGSAAPSATPPSSSSSARCCAASTATRATAARCRPATARALTRSRQIHRLHDELQRAVEREEFEHAAGIRDEIKRLESELQEQAPAAEEKP